MGFFRNVRTLPQNIERIKKSYNQLVAMINREKSLNAVPLRTNSRSQLEEYRSWVYSCISLVSNRISTIPFHFENKNTKEELTTSNKGYAAFTKPFFHPNDLMSFRFIKSWCQIQLDLCGMACLYKAYNGLNQVWEIWPLNMNDFVEVLINGQRSTSLTNSIINPDVKYIFRSGAGFIDFDINELIVLNYPHPTNIYNGMSPIQSQAYAVDIDKYVEVYERDFFKNSARVDFVLATDLPVGPDKAKEIKERWLEKFRSVFHDVAVLDSGLKPIPLKYTNKDFEFLELAKWTKQKVLACYSVPEEKLGTAVNNRSGSVQADISFNRECVHPRLVLWDEELSEGILSSFDSRIVLVHENPIPRDRLIEVQEHKTKLAGVPSLAVNEYRKKVEKLGPVDEGDVILVKKDFIPLDLLRRYVEAEIKSKEASAKRTANEDRDRDGETPHLNPDGSDDRDDNPTEGRNLINYGEKNKCLKDFSSLIDNIRPIWNQILFEYSKNIDSFDNFKKNINVFLFNCVSSTISILAGKWGYSNICDKVDYSIWVKQITDKAAEEFNKTLQKNPLCNNIEWKQYFKEQFDENVRISKIINTLIRGTINYTKWMIISERKESFKWIVNSNECGHRGRIKDFISNDGVFKIGSYELKFPGESFSLNCDCTIINHIGDK